MTKRDFDRYFQRYEGTITAIARKLARRDDDLVADLAQEGAIALWQLDIRKARQNPDAWIRQAVKNRMIDYLRKQNPQRSESLDALLENGCQLESDGLGIRLVTPMYLILGRKRTYRAEEPPEESDAS